MLRDHSWLSLLLVFIQLAEIPLQVSPDTFLSPKLPLAKNLYESGEIITLEVKKIDPLTGGVQVHEEEFEVVQKFKGGYAGRGLALRSLRTGTMRFIKIFDPPFAKRGIRSGMYGALKQAHPWSEQEVQMSILAREIFADVTKAYSQDITGEPATPLVATSSREYAWIKEHDAFGVLMDFHEFDPMAFGIYFVEDGNGVSADPDQEVQERLEFMRCLYQLFDQIGADGYKSQVMVNRSEPLSNKRIGIAALSFLAALQVSWISDGRLSWMWLLATLLSIYYASGSSWFSLPNVVRDKEDGRLKLLDTDVALPHTVILWPTAMAWIGGIIGLSFIFHFSLPVILFLALLGVPGYLHLYELPLFIKDFARGSIAPYGRIDTARLWNFLEDHEDRFLKALGEEGLAHLWAKIETFEKIQDHLEQATPDFFNRLTRRVVNPFRRLFGRERVEGAPLRLRELQRENIHRWELRGKVSGDILEWLKTDPKAYWRFLGIHIETISFAAALVLIPLFFGHPVSLAGSVPAALLLLWYLRWYRDPVYQEHLSWLIHNAQYRNQVWQNYRNYKTREWMAKGRLTQQWKEEEIGNGYFLLNWFVSKLTPRQVHRFLSDGEYRVLLLSNTWKAITFNREFLDETARKRFLGFLEAEKTTGHISVELYDRLQKLENEPQMGGYIDLQFLYIAYKPVSYLVRLGLLAGILGMGGVDLVPYLTGWQIGLLIWMGPTSLYKFMVTPMVGKIYGFRTLETLFMALISAVPVVGSFVSIPLVLQVKSWRTDRGSYVSDFWKLMGVRWQRVVSHAARIAALGSGGEGTLWQYYMRKLWVDIPIGALRFLRRPSAKRKSRVSFSADGALMSAL